MVFDDLAIFEPTGNNGTVSSYTSLSVCLSVVCHSFKIHTGPKFISQDI